MIAAGQQGTSYVYSVFSIRHQASDQATGEVLLKLRGVQEYLENLPPFLERDGSYHIFKKGPRILTLRYFFARNE